MCKCVTECQPFMFSFVFSCPVSPVLAVEAWQSAHLIHITVLIVLPLKQLIGLIPPPDCFARRFSQFPPRLPHICLLSSCLPLWSSLFLHVHHSHLFSLRFFFPTCLPRCSALFVPDYICFIFSRACFTSKKKKKSLVVNGSLCLLRLILCTLCKNSAQASALTIFVNNVCPKYPGQSHGSTNYCIKTLNNISQYPMHFELPTSVQFPPLTTHIKILFQLH